MAVALAAAIGWLPVAPLEHVHEVSDHEQPHALVHRHIAPHASLPHAPDHDGVIDENESPTQTLTATFAPAWAVGVGEPPNWTVTDLGSPLVDLALVGAPDREPRIHGPPARVDRSPRPAPLPASLSTAVRPSSLSFSA